MTINNNNIELERKKTTRLTKNDVRYQWRTDGLPYKALSRDVAGAGENYRCIGVTGEFEKALEIHLRDSVPIGV